MPLHPICKEESYNYIAGKGPKISRLKLKSLHGQQKSREAAYLAGLVGGHFCQCLPMNPDLHFLNVVLAPSPFQAHNNKSN